MANTCINAPSFPFNVQRPNDFGSPRYVYRNSLRYSRIEDLISDFEKNAVFNPNKPDIDYDLLSKNTVSFNRHVKSEADRLNSIDPNLFSTTYPNLTVRIETNPFITPAEVDRIIEIGYFLPESFDDVLTPGLTRALTAAEEYFSPTSLTRSSMGSFCDLVPNLFAKFAQFQAVFDQVMNIADNLENIIQKIENFSVAALLESLKQRVLSLIDQMVIRVLDKVRRYTAGFIDVDYQSNNAPVAQKLERLKSGVERSLSEDLIENIKDKVKGLIAYAASVFEDPSIEEIQFLILRFCEFTSNIENFFNNLTKPLEEVRSNYERANNVLSSSGNLATANAIAAGATRFESSFRAAEERRADAIPASPNAPPVGTYNPPEGAAVAPINDDGSAGSYGRGLSYLEARARSGRVRPPTPAEVDEVSQATYDAVRGGSCPWVQYTPGPSSSRGGRYGWDGIRLIEKVMLMRLSKDWMNRGGGKPTIISGWRSIESQRGTGPYAGSGVNPSAPNSWHCSGQAYDISTGSIGNPRGFQDLALTYGFGARVIYTSQGFIHIDSRTTVTTSWG